MGVCVKANGHLAEGVGHAADVVRHEAEAKHQQQAQDATVGLPIGVVT